MVRRYQIRLMRSVNARCVSIGLVLALSNCSESGGEPDAMLDMHHPGTGIDSHHPQFHNSYGNMKFIIIVSLILYPRSWPSARPTQLTAIGPRSASQVLGVSRGAFLFVPPPSPFRRWTPTADNTANKFRFPPRISSAKRLEKWDPRPLKNYSSFLLPFVYYY